MSTLAPAPGSPAAWIAAGASALVGAALWLFATNTAGGREAWDAPGYWQVAYPLALLASGVLGALFPRGAWRWPLLLFLAQAATLFIRAGELGNLWPLAIAMFLILALPGIALALFGAWLRGRIARR
jgi:hypothetical protein